MGKAITRQIFERPHDRTLRVKHIPGGVCFDFNGVIIDDERHHSASFLATLADEGMPLDEATFYREYLGHDDRACFEMRFGGVGVMLDDTALAELIAKKRARYRDLLVNDLTLVPGVTDFIMALLQRESPLAIASAAPREEIDFVLRHCGLDECFTTIIASADVTLRKPDPEPYLRAIALLGLPAKRCVAIEDSPVGFASARGAGLSVVMLTTSWSREALEQEQPAAVWDDFAGRRPEELPWTL
jgi:phosphoglycolate phosphatase/beta-phosphoglucomutase